MTCHAAIQRPLLSLFCVTFRHPCGWARFIVNLRAEDAGSATLLGLARLAQAHGEGANAWAWAGTERLSA